MKIKFNKKQKKIFNRIIIGFVLFIAGIIVEHTVPENILTFGTKINFVLLIINLAACIIVSYDVLIKTGKMIARGKVFNEEFLMCLAVFGAFCTGEFEEAVEVMLFFQIGQLFENYAVGMSRNSISDLMTMYPEEAVVIRDGKEITVDPDEVVVGDTVLVKPGEKVPVDGTIMKGSATVDTSALTGESVPSSLKEGDMILSGSINLSGVLEIKAEKEFGESTVSKILELVENASEKKSHAENFVGKFAKYYTPIVVILALLVAFVPPFVSLVMGADSQFVMWIQRALIFLVVSCPCAIVISVPLAFFGSIGGASKDGILIKGGNSLEALAKSEIVVMDKTGTLTEGKFSVSEVKPCENISNESLIEYAALAESFSNHPIALSLKNAYAKEIDKSRVSDVKEISGFGVSAKIDEKEVFAGKYDLLKNNNIDAKQSDFKGTIVYVAVSGKYIGYVGISDKIKADSPAAVAEMKKLGVKQTVMLTGDSKATGEYVASQLKLDKVYTKLLPADKVEKMEELRKTLSKNGTIIFAGDGMNDAPVLASVDAGIAMGAMGSDAAIEAADIVIMDDKPSKIPVAIKHSKKCMSIVWGNVVFALFIKCLVLFLATIGHANMFMGILADVGVTIVCILNSMRTLRNIKK